MSSAENSMMTDMELLDNINKLDKVDRLIALRMWDSVVKVEQQAAHERAQLAATVALFMARAKDDAVAGSVAAEVKAYAKKVADLAVASVGDDNDGVEGEDGEKGDEGEKDGEGGDVAPSPKRRVWYSEEEMERIRAMAATEEGLTNAAIEALATEFGRPVSSVRAKVKKMKLYKPSSSASQSSQPNQQKKSKGAGAAAKKASSPGADYQADKLNAMFDEGAKQVRKGSDSNSSRKGLSLLSASLSASLSDDENDDGSPSPMQLEAKTPGPKSRGQISAKETLLANAASTSKKHSKKSKKKSKKKGKSKKSKKKDKKRKNKDAELKGGAYDTPSIKRRKPNNK